VVTLVTGATGFIGSHLLAKLRAEGRVVRVLVRPGEDVGALRAAAVEVAFADIRDPARVRPAVAGCERVFHLAALTEEVAASPAEIWNVNVLGTENVTRAAAEAGVERLVACSSVGVYGRTTVQGAVDEDTPPRPDSVYGQAKLEAERRARTICAAAGIELVVARPTAVLGPGGLSWRGLVRAVASGQFRILGGGRNRHHCIDVSDLVDGLVRCADTPGIGGRAYLLGASQPIELGVLLDLVADAVPAPRPLRLPGKTLLRVATAANSLSWRLLGRKLPRADRIDLFLSDRAFSSERARRELGFAPRTSMPEAVERTVRWLAERGHLSPA
jgi:nucleoside-diphosphate-sugar epimerase